MKSKEEIIALAPFGISRKDQHLIDDDLWYSTFFSNHTYKLVYIAGSYASQILSEKFSENTDVSIVKLPVKTGRLYYELRIVWTLAKQLRRRSSCKVVFLAYSETLVTLCAPLLLYKKCDITLVNTNNLTQVRLKKYYWPIRLMHFLISKCLSRFLVHTEYEKRLVTKHFPFLQKKTIIKKHHMMMPVILLPEITCNKGIDDEIIISCFGPLTTDKSLDIISFILKHFSSYDRLSPKIQIRLFRIAENALPSNLLLKNTVRLSFSQEFLSHHLYKRKIKESHLVILNHTEAFEGKLSGIFCDCISLNVPFIALDIEPMSSFNDINGQIGFLLPVGNEAIWHKPINAAINPESFKIVKTNIERLSTDFKKPAIDLDYLTAFDLQYLSLTNRN